MDDMEEKLGSILSNPQMMQQIMSMASALGASQPSPAPQPPQPSPVPQQLPDIDLGMLQKLSGLAGQTGIDPDQQALLRALCPYLSRDRIDRLERAMRAAKTARVATDLLGSGGLNFLTGR